MRFARTTGLLLGVILLVLWQGLLLSCQAPQVTSSGQPVNNPALATAAHAVEISELAVVVATDALTTLFEAGQLSLETLETFQTTIAPKITAALSSAREALKTWAKTPALGTPANVLAAVLTLEQEVRGLQGFLTTHKGDTK